MNGLIKLRKLRNILFPKLMSDEKRVRHNKEPVA